MSIQIDIGIAEQLRQDRDYIFVLLMRALELETGSIQKTWELVLRAHESQLNDAPSEISGLLTDSFERLIANRFGNPTKH